MFRSRHAIALAGEIASAELPLLDAGGAAWLSSVLDQIWPTYDLGKLAGTANAWHSAADSVDAARDSLRSALTALVDHNSGDALNALNQFWEQFVSGAEAIFPALDTAINAIARRASATQPRTESTRGCAVISRAGMARSRRSRSTRPERIWATPWQVRRVADQAGELGG